MLTKEEYFTKDNKYLSNSKLNWFEKDKSLFKKFFIDGEYEDKPSDPMIIGSAVDTWLTEGKEEFERQYLYVTKRNRKGDTPWERQLNKTMYEEVENLCKAVERQSVYQHLKDFEKQKMLYWDMPIGEHFKGLCGILDFLKVEDDRAIIVDLKTMNGQGSPSTYNYKCLDSGYYRQMAMYSLLVEKNYNIHDIECFHLVIQRDADGIFPVYFFKFSGERIQEAKREIDELITELKKETKFKPRDTKWEDYIEI